MGKTTDEGVAIIDIILCAASTLSEQELKERLQNAKQLPPEINPRLENVPRWPAYNKHQLADFSALWPVTLRMDAAR